MPQGVSYPFGDAHIIQTPYLDRFSQQLFAEQKQREIMRQRQQAALDDEFSKNVANIRDADVDDVTRKYGEWKMMNQQLMKKRGGISPQEQMELLRKKAEISKVINASKIGKQEEEDWFKIMSNKPDDFDDDAYGALTTRRRTPISQIGEYKVAGADGKEKVFNLRDLNSLRYKGTDTDFSKIDKEAAGTPRLTLTEDFTEDEKDPFTLKAKTWMYGNSPQQFYESYLGALAQKKAGRDAEAIVSKIPQETFVEIQERFKAIPVETWKRMGVDKPQELVITAEDGKAQVLAKHKAQLYALNNQPKEGKQEVRKNEKAYFDAQKAKDKEMADYRHKLAVALKKTPGAKTEGSEDDSLYLEDYVDGITDDAINTGQKTLHDGSESVGYTVKADPVLLKALTKQGIEPDVITVDEKGNYTPLYYETNKDGERVWIKELSKPITRTQLLLSLGVKTTTGKQRYKEGKSAVEGNKTNNQEDLRKKYNY